MIPATATALGISEKQVQAVAALLEDGATIPFIARYRKEATGSLDEVAVARIRDTLHQLKELDDRRQAVLASLEKNGHLTDELKQRVLAADTLTVLEDIYLPFRPKRRTRAVMAREKGLEPLALVLLEQKGTDPQAEALPFVDPEKGVASVDEALAGARDIIAEMTSEDEAARSALRDLFFTKGMVSCRVVMGMEEAGAKFRDYFDWKEPVATVPSHRMLAMRRGEKEGFLVLAIAPEEPDAIAILERLFVKGDTEDAVQVALAVKDSYKRLLSLSMETETRLAAKKKADAEAIRIFAENLRQLLLAPPLGAKRVMGIDPGFRTGCKVVCLDRQGKLLCWDTVYPHFSEGREQAAADRIKSLCDQFEVEAIAVGNGTAGRETEAFVKAVAFSRPVQVVMVNESGASIYSASEVAREEFPDHDLTVRGSVSIARRLMDPLAELVKSDPKSIGVGQYQHDVSPAELKQSLDDVVVSCVNRVGVDLNRASAQLLTYVSGLNAGIAKNILVYREANGPFASREALKAVPRFGPKTFEQSAGFLRIPDAANPLDASAVHPESYAIVEAMAKDLGKQVADIMHQTDLRKQVDLSAYVTGTVGLPTLTDILDELAKPGRDPRQAFESVSFIEGINTIDDVQPGMKLPGIVTNITAFGAFVDIGVHQDGLVHISQMADRFVKSPADIVKVQQRVMVTVLEVDKERKRISLSMKAERPAPTAAREETAGPSPRPDTPGKAKGKKPEKKEKRNIPANSALAEALRKSGLT
ncbi:Tex family protein [Desulfosudis oleivorans]|uniref:RNA binding S1 domain protein n=1 Tax=Desulfosudis oleivorans (strain DSM 6200 / JCM 39069 / Hxd3) TaxID=96561 RepID=A8ZSR0_DESOH|nr:Tex family protein [Desulfosudis oleivorans]ABW65973.1 RNA binding S1 domain protein [Desulfosudis oleivorans Hxd3]